MRRRREGDSHTVALSRFSRRDNLPLTASTARRALCRRSPAMHDDTLVYWSAHASGLAFFAAVLLAGRRMRDGSGTGAMRAAWTAACALLIAHEILAMGISFGWSQRRAWDDIAARTDAMFGIGFGGGLIVNYATVAVWAADVAWQWIWPAPHASRRPAVGAALWLYVAAMFFFGAVVFAEGAVRWISAALFVVAAAWLGICSAWRGRVRPANA